jgi:uncharacterized protein (DUF58 family)
MAAPILDPASLAAYDRLALHVRRGMGERPGDRRFPGRPEAAGIEIEAHRPYTPGDDLRHLDWSALARLDALVVRRFTAEREVPFHLLLDCSASMDAPPRDRKLAAARELTMALAWMALASNDAVRVVLLGGDARESAVHRQRASALRVWAVLAGAQARGSLRFGAALEAYARRHPQPGAAIVVSDLMTDPGEVAAGLRALRARRYDVLLLHVIGPSEIDPRRQFTRGVLTDVETGDTHPMALDAASLTRYRELLDDHLARLAAAAARAEVTYARLVSDASVPGFVTGELARLRVVRRR